MREVFAAGISFFVFIENIGFFGGFVPGAKSQSETTLQPWFCLDVMRQVA
jgi:hypothetical protein